MARLLAVLALLLLLPPPPPALPLQPLMPGNGSLPGCQPDQFRCGEPRAPEGDCFPREWLCDGHPDCEDEWDERGCGPTGSPEVPSAGSAQGTAPGSSAEPGAGSTEASATPVPGHSLPSRSQGCLWMLIIAGIFRCEVIRWD